MSRRGAAGNHPLYRIWESMRARCNSPGARCYHRYGGRGISICREWDDFWQFVKDVGPRPEGASLDRIDNDGNYEPGNCRWASRSQQAQNSRSVRKITFNGITRCVTDWAVVFGITQSALSHRIRKHGVDKAMHMGRP